MQQHHKLYKNPLTTNLNRLHEIKTKKRKCNIHQDLSNDSATMWYFLKKKTPFIKLQVLSNIISNNVYNNFQHIDNNVIFWINNENIRREQIQRTQNARRSQSIQIEVKKIKVKKNHLCRNISWCTISLFPWDLFK